MNETHTGNKYKNLLKKYGVTLLFISPYLVMFISLVAFPIVSGFLISFFKYDPTNLSETKFVGLSNYLLLFDKERLYYDIFWPALGKTFLFAGVAVPCLIIIPLSLAYLINIKPPFYKLFRAIIYLPSVVSITIVGLSFGTIFSGTETGLINALFGTKIQFLSVPSTRWLVILIASIWWQTGTNFVILSAALRNVPKHLYEAAQSDGAGKWRLFFDVTLPNIKGELGICLFNTLIGYMCLYGQPSVINSKENVGNIETPMMYIQYLLSDGSRMNRTGLISAIAIFFGLIVMIVAGLERKLMKTKTRGKVYEYKYRAYTEKKTN